MSLTLLPVTDADLVSYKKDMQEAFQWGAVEGGYPLEGDEVILPEEDIDRSLGKKNAIAYKAVQDGVMVGGAIVVLDAGKHSGYLDFLYVKHGLQSRGIGKFIWFAMEERHPEIHVWETCTPYFEKRNLHFYINVCGFHVTEFWNEHHRDHRYDPVEPDTCGEADTPMDDDGMFGFRKEVYPGASKEKI